MTAVRKDRVEFSYADALIASGIAGQAAILEEELKMGVSLTYEDEHGNLVQKHPDGSITPRKK